MPNFFTEILKFTIADLTLGYDNAHYCAIIQFLDEPRDASTSVARGC